MREELGQAYTTSYMWESRARCALPRGEGGDQGDEASKASVSIIQIAGHSEKIKRKKKKDINIYC